MSEKSDNERRAEAEAELAELKLQQAKSAQAREVEAALQAQQVQNKPKNPVMVGLGIAIALAIAAGAAFVLTRGGDEVALTDAEQILEYQTACFEATLFYDDNGACFDDGELTQRNTTVNPDVTAASASATTVAASGGVAAPAAPQAPVPAAPSPATTDAPEPPTTQETTATTTAGGDTTTEAPSAPTTADTADTTAATTAPQPAINIDRSGWSLRLAVLAEDGVSCDADPKPSHCNDALSGQYNIEFAVADGLLSGTKSGAINGQTVAINGEINPNGSLQYLTAELQNGQGVTQSFIEMSPGTLTDDCNMSGSYAHSIGNPRYVMSGTYTMRRSTAGC